MCSSLAGTWVLNAVGTTTTHFVECGVAWRGVAWRSLNNQPYSFPCIPHQPEQDRFRTDAAKEEQERRIQERQKKEDRNTVKR